MKQPNRFCQKNQFLQTLESWFFEHNCVVNIHAVHPSCHTYDPGAAKMPLLSYFNDCVIRSTSSSSFILEKKSRVSFFVHVSIENVMCMLN
jgi:hypothetical protein